MRGEQVCPSPWSKGFWGSPPLARGTVFFMLVSLAILRITPACAGNSPNQQHFFTAYLYHPRLRGEQSTLCTKQAVTLGSPPLARGTVHGVLLFFFYFGITPACAGNSTGSAGEWNKAKDHPRLRGEQPRADLEKWVRRKSPPLARGTAVGIHKFNRGYGITPACAGNRPKETGI